MAKANDIAVPRTKAEHLRSIIAILLLCHLALMMPEALASEDGLPYADMILVAEGISRDLLEGRTEKAEDTVTHLVKKKTRSSTNDIAIIPILNLVFENNAHRFEGIVQKLVESKPLAITPRLLKGKFFHSYAWQARGEKFISNTASGALVLYRERLRVSFNEFKEVLKLEPKNYVAAYYLFQLSKDLNLTPSERESYFNLATAEIPFFLSAYLAKTDALAPKWGGSESELFKFVADHAWANDPNSSLPFIVSVAYSNVCRDHGGKREYYSTPQVWGELEKSYELLIKRFPKAAYFKVMYAKDLFVVGKTQRGLELLGEAAELEPNHPEIVAQLEKHPEVLQGAKPDNSSELAKADEFRIRAKESYKANDWPTAERLYSEVVRLDPTDAHSWYLLGFINDKNGNYQKAVINFDRAINLRPNKASYYTYRCHSKMLSGQIEAGINDCTKAISIDTREKYAYLNRAHAYQMIGKMKEANQDLQIGNSLAD